MSAFLPINPITGSYTYNCPTERKDLTMTVNLNVKAAELEKIARQYVEEIAAASKTAADLRNGNTSKTALLSAIAVDAVLNRVEKQVTEALAPPSDASSEEKKSHPWQKSKGAWSNAVSFANWLRAGNKLPLPPRNKGQWILDSKVISEVTWKDLPAFVACNPSDTTIPAIVKVWRAHRKELEKAAQSAASENAAAYAAFLECLEGEDVERYAGEDAESLEAFLKMHATPEEQARVLSEGMAKLEAYRARQAEIEARELVRQAIDAACRVMSEATDSDIERLINAITIERNKRAIATVKELPASDTETESDSAPLRKAS